MESDELNRAAYYSFVDVQYNLELRELRLNGNRITSVPETLQHNSR